MAAPTPAIAPRPDVDVDLSADTLAIRGLGEATTADVVVARDGREVARADGLAVQGGTVRVATWPLADALRPGDVVTVRPHGTYLQAPFATELPALSADAGATAWRGPPAWARGRSPASSCPTPAARRRST